MEDASSFSRSELVEQLQSTVRRVAQDDRVPLVDVADQLETLAKQMRQAYNASVPCGPPSTSAAAATAPTLTDVPTGVPPSAPSGGNGCESPASTQQPTKKQRRAAREFDFSRYRRRLVALELMYVGWGFQGFARQDDTENTIEGVLFSALRKVKLIPEASEVPVGELGYSRCGRTDRGVSALGQVVALQLRSVARVDQPEVSPESEYDYPRLVNRALPPTVRVLGWTTVGPDFNARFSALYREYKYFIIQQYNPQPSPSCIQQDPPQTSQTTLQTASSPLTIAVEAAATAMGATDHQPNGGEGAGGVCGGGGGLEYTSRHQTASNPDEVRGDRGSWALDIEAMRKAAAYFVGEHDFRNFCKPDIATVRNFRRRILSFTIDPVPTSCGADRDTMSGSTAEDGATPSGGGQKQQQPHHQHQHQVYALTVRGTAFLWHQVRCMAAVLLMVGRRQEAPEVVSALLDIIANPRKPQYSMAPEEPLLLYACGFSGLTFRRSSVAVEGVLADVGGLLQRHLIGAALTSACYHRIAADTRTPGEHGPGAGAAAAGGGGGASGHMPLLRRQTEPSIEERMARRGIPWPPVPDSGTAGIAGRAAEGGDEGDAMLE